MTDLCRSSTGYRVSWEIDVTADDPVAAAREAFAAMQRPGTTATVFEVADEHGNITTVDLLEEDEK